MAKDQKGHGSNKRTTAGKGVKGGIAYSSGKSKRPFMVQASYKGPTMSWKERAKRGPS